MKTTLIFFFLLLTSYSNSKTITVCKSCSIKTIKNGISLADEGDTVLVKKGVYKETIIMMNDGIQLVGVDMPTIDGQYKKESIIAVSGNNFSISGFKFRNVGMSYTKEISGVFVSKSRNFTIKDNDFRDVFYSLIIQSSKYGVIKNNTVIGDAREESSSGNGIHVWKSSHLRIEENIISGMRDGIYLEFVDYSHISHNTSFDNLRYGLHFMFSDNNEYHHNEFMRNGAGVAVMFSNILKCTTTLFTTIG